MTYSIFPLRDSKPHTCLCPGLTLKPLTFQVPCLPKGLSPSILRPFTKICSSSLADGQARFPCGPLCGAEGMRLLETGLADNNLICSSSVLIPQEKPLGKIYGAIGTQEYFASGDPGHLRSAPPWLPVSGELKAAGLTGWPWALHAWSAQQLSRGLPGRHAGGCLSSKGGPDLPSSLGCQKQCAIYSLPPPASSQHSPEN